MTSLGVCLISTFVLAYVCGLCYGDLPVCTLIEVSAGDGSTISSPDYPNDYPNQNCTIWRITSTTRVVLNITAFSLEDRYDFLYIYDDYINIARLTGEVIPDRTVYESSQHYVSVQFTSDIRIASTGFSATITPSPGETTSPAATTAPDVCTLIEVSADTESTISSPRYPSNYPDYNCTIWRITSATQVVLNITAFNLEEDYDFLYIYDDYINIARLTGSADPAQSVYESSQHFMSVQFTSDTSENQTGFSATVTSTPAPLTTTVQPTTTSLMTNNVARLTTNDVTSMAVQPTAASLTTNEGTSSTLTKVSPPNLSPIFITIVSIVPITLGLVLLFSALIVFCTS